MKLLTIFASLLFSVALFGQTTLTNPVLSANRLQDFNVLRLSGSVLRWSPSFTSSAPGVVQLNDTIYTYTTPLTITRTGGNGTLRLYVTSGGSRACSVSDDLTVSGMVCSAGSSFPTGSVMRYSWTSSSGSWAASGTDYRSFVIGNGVSGVTAGSYGDSTHSPRITVGADGRITSVTEQSISGGGGSPDIQSEGTTVSTGRAKINFKAGTGIIETIEDDGANNRTNVTHAVNDAEFLSQATAQVGTPWACSGSGSASAQTCNLVPAIGSYSTNQRLNFVPGTSNTTTQSLAVNGLSALQILRHNGDALQANDLVAGRQYTLWNDGASHWRLLVPSVSASSTPDETLYETQGFTNVCGHTTTQSGSSAVFGLHGWGLEATNWNSGATAYSNNNPCYVEISTNSTTNDKAGIAGGFNDISQFSVVLGTAGWKFEPLVSIPTITNVNVIIGLCHANAANPALCKNGGSASGIAAVFNTSIGSNWLLRTCTTGTCTDVDTGVAVSANTIYRLRLDSTTNGTARLSVNGSTAVTASTPTATRGVVMNVETLTSAVRKLQFKAYGWAGIQRLQ